MAEMIETLNVAALSSRPGNEIADAVLADLHRRWASGQRVFAEEYFSALPMLSTQPELAVGIINSEVQSRRACGESPQLSEYQERFPRYAGRLTALFAPRDTPNASDNQVSLREMLASVSLVEPERTAEFEQVTREASSTPDEICRNLLGRGLITEFQAQMLGGGRGGELLLGDYLLLDLLGEGGMGQVFKARHKIMNRVVALKVIRKARFRNANAVLRFQREIHAAALLAHPNIVMAFDAAQVGDVHFLVMEYVEGVDLAKLLRKRGQLPVGEACDYAFQVALGLQHAHEQGLVHRDIKPANLLRADKGKMIKILDFGLARIANDETIWVGEDGDPENGLTLAGHAMGTPDYVAPEQTIDARSVDIRADIYSLGCTLYHMLTGRAPFPSGSAGDKLQAHQFRMPLVAIRDCRDDMPVAVALIVERMMAKRPADRFQTPGEIALALAAFRTPVVDEVAAVDRPGSRGSSGMGVAPATETETALGPKQTLRDRMEAAWAQQRHEVEEARARQLPVLRNLLEGFVDSGKTLQAYDTLTAILKLAPDDREARTLREQLRPKLRSALAMRRVRFLIGFIGMIVFFGGVFLLPTFGFLVCADWLASTSNWGLFGRILAHVIRGGLGFVTGMLILVPIGEWLTRYRPTDKRYGDQGLVGVLASCLGIASAVLVIVFPWFAGIVVASVAALVMATVMGISPQFWKQGIAKL